MKSIDDLIASALELDLADRAELAERLLQSLSEISEQEAEALWLDEAERRIREFKAGLSEAIPAESVINEARELLS